MTRLGPQSQDLLARYRAAERLDSPDLERMEQGLFEKLARGESALAGIDPSPVALPRASWLTRFAGSSLAKLNSVLLIAAAGAATLWYGGGGSRPEPVQVVQPVRVAQPAPPPAAAPVVEPQPRAAPAVVAPEPPVRKPKPARARRAPTVPIAEPALPVPLPDEPSVPEEPNAPANSPAQWHRVESPLDSELGLLRHAYSELNANRPARALEALQEHAYRFPRGELAEPREVAHMLALCALDREAEAKARARRFLAQRPRSPFAGRVRALCPIALPKTEP